MSARTIRHWLLLSFVVAGLVCVLPANASGPPSGVGNQVVQWIAVSPFYRDTGLVVATTLEASGCSKNCTRLWVTHDGGSSWKRARAQGWMGGRIDIAVDSNGRETLYSAGPQRSDDEGETWTTVGSGGTPTPFVTYPKDGMVAVAGGDHDYVLHGASKQTVSGSGGALIDFEFSFAPSFPTAGRFSPAFLVGVNKQNKQSYVEHCSPSLSCSSPATLAGTNGFSLPVTLHPSSDFEHDGVMFAKAGRGIYKSKDGGATFAVVPVAGPGATATAYPMLALAPGYKEAGPVRTVYVAVLQVFSPSPAEMLQHKPPHSSGGVFRSTDGGLTWSSTGGGSPLDNGSSGVAVAPDGRLFAGYLPGAASQYSGLLCSTNGGRTWRASCPKVGSKRHVTSIAACTTAGCTTSTGAAVEGVSPGPSGTSSGVGTAGEAQASPNAGTGALSAVRSRWPVILGGLGVLIVASCATLVFFRRRNRRPTEPGG